MTIGSTASVYGTWQFMFAELLAHPFKRQSVQDDMESFLWLVLYYILRYMNNVMIGLNLADTMRIVFNQHVGGSLATGGLGKHALLTHGAPLDARFVVTGNGPMTQVFWDVLDLWGSWYQYKIAKLLRSGTLTDEETSSRIASNTNHLEMKDHNVMISVFAEALAREDWPEDDAADDYLARFRKGAHDGDVHVRSETRRRFVQRNLNHFAPVA